MRQVVELSIILFLALISFVLLLLSIFLGGGAVWKDMERRYTFSVLGLPVARTTYLLGKFFGIAAFLAVTTIVLGTVGGVVVKYVAAVYPPLRPVAWMNLSLALLFLALKYILLVAIAFLFSTVSTSFFLPIFGTLAIFFIGSSLQQVYDFLHSSMAQAYSPILKAAATGLYYLLPNFSAFDLSVNAIYGVGLGWSGPLLTLCYFIVYTSIVLTLSAIAFNRREMP